jgi:DNA-binding NarL/FixJ family response regulator
MNTEPGQALRILVVDDNLVVRRGLTSLLRGGGHTTAGEAADVASAVRLTRSLRPDVVLMDVRMLGDNGLAALDDLVAVTRVLIVTHLDSGDMVGRVMLAGATGYLVHGHFTSEELLEAVAATAAGRTTLSPTVVEALVENLRTQVRQSRRARSADTHGLSRREMEIMEHVTRGRGNAQIARTLYLSEKTVKNHINHINAKLGTRNRAEAIALWLGLTGPVMQN